jgi:hypothetical protein
MVVQTLVVRKARARSTLSSAVKRMVARAALERANTVPSNKHANAWARPQSATPALLELQEPGVLPLAFPLPLAYRPFFKAFGSRRRVGSPSKSGSGELSDRESLPAAAGDAADLRPHAAS